MCNELAFNIGTTTTVTRSWTIKVISQDYQYNNRERFTEVIFKSIKPYDL